MITSGAASAPHLPHHRRVTLQTRRTAGHCRSPAHRDSSFRCSSRGVTASDFARHSQRQYRRRRLPVADGSGADPASCPSIAANRCL